MHILEPHALYAAIEKRRAYRRFIGPLSDVDFATLRRFAQLLNEQASETIHIDVFQQGGEALFKGKKSYGMIHGAQSYAVLARTTSPDSDMLDSFPHALSHMRLGYFGEQLALKITQLGYGSCWVGGTYDKAAVQSALPFSTTVVCVMPIGEASPKPTFLEWLKNRFSSTYVRKRKPLEELLITPEKFATAPEWMRNCVEAMRLAPSSYNKQPWAFELRDDAIALHQTVCERSFLDMGIAMAHLEIAASAQGITGNWSHQDNVWIFTIEK